MSSNLLSAVIKSHSLMADLLHRQQLLSLAQAESREAFIQRLSKTPYAKMLMKNDDNPPSLEKIFHHIYIQRVGAMRNAVPTNMAEFIQAYCLKFEVYNLERILHGKFTEASTTQIREALLPNEQATTLNVTSLVNVESVDEVIRALAHTRFSLRPEYVALYHQYSEIWPLELALQQKYAIAVHQSIHQLPQTTREFVKNTAGIAIDIENLLFIIKHKSSFQEIIRIHELNELFPIRWGITLASLKDAIHTRDSKHFIEQLPQAYAKILSPINQGNELLMFIQLRKHLHEEARHRRLLNDYNHNVIWAYLLFCEIERHNLVGIAYAKSQNIPIDDILRYIVLPPQHRVTSA